MFDKTATECPEIFEFIGFAWIIRACKKIPAEVAGT